MARNLISGTPSKITTDYWVHASSKITSPSRYKPSVSGKWLVFSDVKDHDRNWRKIKRATEKGILGPAAKAATGKQNDNAIFENEKVICVYTNNWKDRKDVFRVESALRSIGINQVLYYKTDGETSDEKYRKLGSQGIAKYISKAVKSTDKNDLASLHNVGPSTIRTLRRIRIKNIDDLLAFDSSGKRFKGISPMRIDSLKIKAIAFVEERIIQITPPELPEGEIIFFDIETDLVWPAQHKKVWSIALYHNGVPTHFYAESFNQEREILVRFLEYIKTVSAPHLLSYSGNGFDKTVVAAALSRHRLDRDFFIGCSHHDLCTTLKKHYILPIGSYALKSVGSFFGYKYKHPDLDGLQVALQYLSYQQSKRKLPQKIFRYIHDDVASLDHILERLRSGSFLNAE